MRAELTEYQTTLEHHLKLQLHRQSVPISQAIANIRALRQSILDTAAALRQTRNNAALLIPKLSSPVLAVKRLTQVQANLNALKEALNHVQTVTNAPSDVAILLDSGEYSAAIDTVAHAKAALSHPHLSGLNALSPVRARLAHSVEQIDNALRHQFRLALADNNELTLNHVVSLVNRMARLPLLSRYFMREIKDDLTTQLSTVTSLHAAAKAAKASASRAVLLANIIQNGQHPDHSSASPPPSQPSEAWNNQLLDAYTDVDDLLAGTVDRILGNCTVQDTLRERVFIVVIPDNHLTPENCFDEFKAALRFGEEVRALKELAQELDHMFAVERRRSALRAKISEKQIAFLSAFHKAHVDALTRTIRSDRWQEVRVNEATSRLLSAVVGPPAVGKPEEHDEGGEGNASQPPPIPAGVIVIGDEGFKTVATGVRYVRSMCVYSLLTEQSPTMRSEFGRRGNDFCRLFNSLVGEAILQAAALQWSALRSITARHLSLASRTIALAVAVATHVNEPLEKALSGAQAKIILPLVKRSEKDLRDHHGQLLAKILAIMMDRLDAHEKTLKSLPWSKQQEMERFEMPSTYAVTLAKEASVLHRILWSVLPTTEVFDIFQRVCTAYGTHLTEAYGVLDGREEWIRARVANDVSCLHNRLRSLDVFKANPALFKPLSKLYARFAKDFFETGTKKASDEKTTDERKTRSLPPAQAVHTSNAKPPPPANPEPKVDKEQAMQAQKEFTSNPVKSESTERTEQTASGDAQGDRDGSESAINRNADSVTGSRTAHVPQSAMNQDELDSSPKEPLNDHRKESPDDPGSSCDTSMPCSSQELSFNKHDIEQDAAARHVETDGRIEVGMKRIPEQASEKQEQDLTSNVIIPKETETESSHEDRPNKELEDSSKESILENISEEKETSASGSPESIREISKANAQQVSSAEEAYQTGPEVPEDVRVESETPESDESARMEADVESGEPNGTTEEPPEKNSVPKTEET